MTNIQLTDFVANIYGRFGLTREKGIEKAIYGSTITSVNIPVYKGQEHIDNMPLSAYMVLAELNYLGGTAIVPDMFSNVDSLSGFANGYLSGVLACLAKRGFVETNAPTSPIVISEGTDGSRHIEKPDGSSYVLFKDGSSQGICIGGPPRGLSTSVYHLKDLKPYHVQLDLTK